MKHLIHVEGRVSKRLAQDGSYRYYYRRRVPFFENGQKKYRDVRESLGTSLERAIPLAKQMDDDQDAVQRGERPRYEMTLTQLIDWYLQQVQRLLSWKTIRSNLSVFLGWLGDMPVANITSADVERFLAWRRQGLEPITVNTTLRDVKRMFNTAVHAGYAERNPAKDIRHLRVVRKLYKLPTDIEVERIMVASQQWLGRIVLVLVATGARLGEVLRLDWSDVDFVRDRLKLRRQKVGDELDLPMGSRLKTVLWEMWEAKGFPTTGPVFLSAVGRPYTNGRVYIAYKRIVKRLGWPWLTLKTFRTYAATQVAMRTGKVLAVQRTLGHSTLRTSELYMQGDEEAKQCGIEALDGLLKGTGGTSGGTLAEKETQVGVDGGREDFEE